ncbi:MAG: hypothetical protein J0L77_01250 [Alphaproteobacteria bacterium]|nr:hypothetical protein [Alphaproteobacteria bacterium]
MTGEQVRLSLCRLSRKRAQHILPAFHTEHPLPHGCSYRLARLQELDILLSLASESFPTDLPTRRGLRHFLTRAHALIFLLISPDQDPIGYLHLEGNTRTKSVYVNTFTLRPGWRGKKLGHSFYTLSEYIAEDAGFWTLRMHISDTARNNLHLAHKNGYEEIWFGAYLEDGSNSYLLRKTLTHRPDKNA